MRYEVANVHAFSASSHYEYISFRLNFTAS